MERNEWMRREIAGWQAEGLLEEGLCQRLRERYPIGQEKDGATWGMLLFGGLGSLMIGLGIIALFAANWEQLNRPARTLVSLLPLALCGTTAVVATWKNDRGQPFWEGLGVLWMVSLVASVSLILQTYQVGGRWSQFFLSLSLLSLPVVWVSRSVFAQCLWMLYPLLWYFALEAERGAGGRGWVALKGAFLLALSLPAFLAFIRGKYSRFLEQAGYFLMGFLYLVTTSLLLCHLLPRHLTWEFPWKISLCWLASAAIWLAGRRWGFRHWEGLGRVSALVVALAVPFLEDGALLMVPLAALFAAVLIAQGIRKLRLRHLNEGALLACWLAVVKFFASEMDFSLKGILFLAMGICLVVVNVSFVRYRRRRMVHGEKA